MPFQVMFNWWIVGKNSHKEKEKESAHTTWSPRPNSFLISGVNVCKSKMAKTPKLRGREGKGQGLLHDGSSLRLIHDHCYIQIWAAWAYTHMQAGPGVSPAQAAKLPSCQGGKGWGYWLWRDGYYYIIKSCNLWDGDIDYHINWLISWRDNTLPLLSSFLG